MALSKSACPTFWMHCAPAVTSTSSAKGSPWCSKH
jgi:hypothetical protein